VPDQGCERKFRGDVAGWGLGRVEGAEIGGLVRQYGLYYRTALRFILKVMVTILASEKER
jgi:hypothetical protein